jgi:deoxyribonuclease V
MTLGCVDVDYRDDGAVAALVGFTAWTADRPAFEHVRASTTPPAAYEPGSFYRRELPYLLDLLATSPTPLTTIVIDGFVWLDGGAKGLGAHLYEAAPAHPIVVGVAKRPWRSGSVGVPIVRGTSAVPLHVTAIGIPVEDAAHAIASMHGAHRIPTLLKRVDRLARDHDRH